VAAVGTDYDGRRLKGDGGGAQSNSVSATMWPCES